MERRRRGGGKEGSGGPGGPPPRQWGRELRRRATIDAPPEDRLIGASDEDDAEGLVEELRVHQAELEIQNEELRTYQHAMEEARDRYYDLYHGAPVAYFMLDPMGVILDANHTASVLLALPVSELVQRRLGFLVRRDDEEALDRHLVDVFASRAKQIVELVLRRSDGREVIARLESVPVVVGETPPERCRTAIIDITSLRRQDAAMRRLATAVADSDDAIFVLDFDGNIRSWNRGARELYGLSEKEALSGTFFRMIPAGQREQFRALLDRLARGHRIRSLGAERIATDGRRLFVSVTGSPLLDPRETARAASFTERDETSRRLAEAALIERELRLRAVVDSAMDGIVVVDQVGRIEQLNPSAGRMFGYATAEAQTLTLEQLVPPPHEDRPRENLGRYCQPGDPGVSAGGELVGRRRDGAEFPVHLSLSEMKLPDRVLYCAFVRDLTSEKELQEELRQSQKMEVLGALAGGIAHDFNNILQAISGNAMLALERLPNGDPLRGWIEKCLRAAMQGGQLTSRLLTFQRRGPRARKPIAIDRVIEGYADLARHVLGDNISLTTGTAAPESAVMAEEGHLEQILLNLVVNARDAMPTGGAISIDSEQVLLEEEVARELGLAAAGSYVRVTVGDTGCGMDEKTRRHLFEPFFTTKAIGRGTGLGLAIVRTIVQQLGGQVDVTSRLGDGTRFVFHFPAVALPPPPPLQTIELRPSQRLRIILADDDPSVREVVQMFLVRLGHEVLSASNGAEVLALIEKQVVAPDLLVTDVIMPAMSGPVLAEAVRRRLPRIQTLFMSAVSYDWLVTEGWLDPVAPIIGKPFDQEALGRAIERVMRPKAPPLQGTILLVDDSAAARDALEDILCESGYRVLTAGTVADAIERAKGAHTIDFLLTDLRLPDGRGEEVARGLGPAHPEMRVMFMSGTAPATPELEGAFFSKPIDLDALLGELERASPEPVAAD